MVEGFLADGEVGADFDEDRTVVVSTLRLQSEAP